MREQEDELEQLGVRVAVVTFEAGFLAQAYVEDTALHWPLLVDEDRGMYQAYGMLSASTWDVWGPRTWFAYAKELLKGGSIKKSDGDVSQRGGDVLIGPDARVRVHHVGDGPADRPEVADLLAVIRHEGEALATGTQS